MPEETLATYLISTLEDSAPDAVDLLELQDIVAGFCPSFDAVPNAHKLALLSTLVQKATVESFPREGWGQQQPHRVEATIQEAPAALHNLQQSTETAECQQAGPLIDLYPGNSPAYLNHVLHDVCHNQLEDAAHWLMDQEDLSKSETSWHACQEQKQRDAAEAARKEKEHRKQLVAKYHLQAVGTSAPTEPKQARQAPKSKNQVRYREGQVVTAKGEKYVTERSGQEWDGGSKGKVVTKGKRGKGIV
ncbi:hypothetical protein WJX82_002527 [Trebouxia sp. C0006]